MDLGARRRRSARTQVEAMVSLTVFGERDVSTRRKAIYELTLELGVVGPASLASAHARVCCIVSRKSARHRVWHHQLENDVGCSADLQVGNGCAARPRWRGICLRCGTVFRGNGSATCRCTLAAASYGHPVRNLENGGVIPTTGWRSALSTSVCSAVSLNALLGVYIQTR